MSAARLFVSTSEHERFEEFCGACRRDRYVGLCVGSPGVGKTMSARRVCQADAFEALRAPFSARPDLLEPLRGLDALLYTPDVINGPRAVTDQVLSLWNRLLFVEAGGLSGPSKKHHESKNDEVAAIVGTQSRTVRDANRKLASVTEALDPKPFLHPIALLIVDEADRLKTQSLEQLRHLFDRGAFGLILIGMPGLEKRLARYPQLYSRIGFVHFYRPLGANELRQILHGHIAQLIGSAPSRGLTTPEVIAAILRITAGNLRLVVRLLTQMIRILEVNGTDTGHHRDRRRRSRGACDRQCLKPEADPRVPFNVLKKMPFNVQRHKPPGRPFTPYKGRYHSQMTRVARRREGEMAEAENQTEERFAAVVASLDRKPGVTHSNAKSRLFGSKALKVHDKIFAMVSSSGHFVVKLPKARVDALVNSGAGGRFEASQGRPMKEWLQVDPASDLDWLELAREALEFVAT